MATYEYSSFDPSGWADVSNAGRRNVRSFSKDGLTVDFGGTGYFRGADGEKQWYEPGTLPSGMDQSQFSTGYSIGGSPVQSLDYLRSQYGAKGPMLDALAPHVKTHPLLGEYVEQRVYEPIARQFSNTGGSDFWERYGVPIIMAAGGGIAGAASAGSAGAGLSQAEIAALAETGGLGAGGGLSAGELAALESAGVSAGTVPTYSFGQLPNTTAWTEPFTLSNAMTAPNAGFNVAGSTVNLANSATMLPTGGGGMWEGIFKDILKPSNLLNIGSQIYGAITGKGAAEDAAAAQLQGGREAIAAQERQFAQTREDMAPWRTAGTMAIGELGAMTLGPDAPLARRFTMADFNADPVAQAGFQFGMDEGRKAIERRAASAGGYDSGATLKALTRFGNDYGMTKAGESYNRFTQDQTNLFNRLAAISGIGQTAANTVATTGMNTANNVSNAAIGMGNARGASTIAGANAVSNAVNNVGSWLMNQEILNRMPVYRMS